MYLRSVGPALLVCLLLVWAMAYCSPQYDDTLMEILRAQGDAETLYAMHLDRPAMGSIFEQLDDRGWLWQGTILLNAIGWGIMATVACRLAVEFFPAKPAVAIAAGLLVVAPILVEMQFVILNNLIYIIAVPMLGLLLLLRPIEREPPGSRRCWQRSRWWLSAGWSPSMSRHLEWPRLSCW